MKDLDVIIGLGKRGCQIASKFQEKYSFQTFLIDTKKKSGYTCLVLEKKNSHEEYEQVEFEDNPIFSFESEQVLFILDGSETISGVSLKFLEKIKHKKIDILYIYPDLDFLNQKKKLQHNATFGVMQEYARSGLFEGFYVLSEKHLLSIVPGVTLVNKHDKLHNYIVDLIYNIVYFYNQNLLMGNEPEFSDHFRIGTFGIMDASTGIEKHLFFFDGAKEKHYIYVVPEKEAEVDVNIVASTQHLFQQKLNNKSKVNYSVYISNFQQKICYVLTKTSKNQGAIDA